MSRQATLRVAFLLVGLLASHRVQGQDAAVDDTTDLQGWTSVALQYRFDERWRISAEEQLRLEDNCSDVDMFFSQLAVRYRPSRGISLEGGLRWIRENDTQGKIQGYESALRYDLSASYVHKLQRLSLGYRVRFQSKQDVGAASSAEANRHLRFRTRVRYNLPNWLLDPIFDAELYRSVGGAAASDFDKMRFTLGTDRRSWSGAEIGVFYRVERELGVDSPQTTHIVGLRFTHVLERK